jgi:hypothetical protein
LFDLFIQARDYKVNEFFHVIMFNGKVNYSNHV